MSPDIWFCHLVACGQPLRTYRARVDPGILLMEQSRSCSPVGAPSSECTHNGPAACERPLGGQVPRHISKQLFFPFGTCDKERKCILPVQWG